MTFTEAAAHVLRLVGKPLHYKEITDVAIEKDLLSHVGKSPEVTMGARLAAVVKKDPKEHPLVRVKPGVFALREWNDAQVAAGLADRTPALERLARIELEQGEESKATEVAEPDPGAEAQVIAKSMAPSALDESRDDDLSDDEKARAELAAAANEFFTAEDDDDEPILGGDEEEEAGERAESGGKRRRRRRRRRGGSDEDGGLPSYTVSEAPPLDSDSDSDDATDEEEEANAGAGNGSRRGESKGHRERERGDSRDRGDRERGDSRERGDRERGDSRDRGDRERGDRRDRAGDDSRSDGRDRGGDSRGGDELSPAAVLRALAQAASSKSKSPATPLRQAAEQIAKRLRGRPDLNSVQDTLVEAIRGEVLEARVARRRPRFVLSNKAVINTGWGLTDELVELEDKMLSAAEKYRQAFAKSFASRLHGLGGRALADLIPLLLRQMGYRDVAALRRPGGHSQEIHFTAYHGSGGGAAPMAVVVRKDGRDLGRERVVELRGSLHHYKSAVGGILITTGQILSGARDEAGAEAASPVTLLDGVALAALCEQHGVGVVWSEFRLPQVDRDLLEQLVGS